MFDHVVLCPFCMAAYGVGDRCPHCGVVRDAYAPLAHHLVPNTVLNGRYVVGRSLGEGGFGITHLGRDMESGLLVAIKEYFPKGAATREGATTSKATVFVGASEKELREGQQWLLREASTFFALRRQRCHHRRTRKSPPR